MARADDTGLTLTSDERTAVIERTDLVMATRASATEPFTITPEPSPLADVIAANGFENTPALNADALSLYFIRTITTPEPATYGMFVAERATSTSTFGMEHAVVVGSTALQGVQPQLSRDGLTLYWKDPPSQLIYSASRSSSLPWGFETQRSAASMEVLSFVVSADQMTLYYSQRDTPQTSDVYATTRASLLVPFQPGSKLTSINSTADEHPLAVSDDGCILYLGTNRGAGYDIWAARRGQ